MSCSVRGCVNRNALTKEKHVTFHVFPHPLNEKFRFQQWLDFCDNPILAKKSTTAIYRQNRICRRHFAKNCFNGDCKRLLKDAFPSLNGFLQQPPQPSTRISIDIDEDSDLAVSTLLDSPSDRQVGIGAMDTFENDGLLGSISFGSFIEEEHIVSNESEDEQMIEEVLLIDEDKEDLGYTEVYIEGAEDLDFENMTSLNEADLSYSYEVSAADISQTVNTNYCSLTDEKLKKWRSDFYEDQKNVLAQNVCSRVDPFEACLSRKAFENTQHVFTYKVESEGKPLTNQKSSGRCWIFATLNCIRIPFMKSLNLDEFEFSQGYLFYWDKIERCHYFLNNIVKTANRGEKVDGRLVSFLLNDPTCDGGQWDMIVNLINKYGLMPKKCFPESYSCEASLRMNAVLKSKLREYAKVLRDMLAEGAEESDLNSKIDMQMAEIYNVVGICLGIPSEEFTWEYYDKSKAYHSVGPLSPMEFYENHVKPVFNVDDKVCLVNDPRDTNAYGRAYTVDCLGNVIGGRPVLYNNQPVELLMDLVAKSLKNGEPVWFGCEVSKRFAGKQGIEDLTIHDFKLVFGVDIQTTISKADRLLYGESAMTHAMAFTAVSCDKDGTPTKFRVENSWGEDRGEKGYLIMSADWFKEFVFEVVVDKSLVPDDVMEVFNMEPVVLPAWDPMGTLAK